MVVCGLNIFYLHNDMWSYKTESRFNQEVAKAVSNVSQHRVWLKKAKVMITNILSSH